MPSSCESINLKDGDLADEVIMQVQPRKIPAFDLGSIETSYYVQGIEGSHQSYPKRQDSDEDEMQE